jgi:hypothetical protein
MLYFSPLSVTDDKQRDRKHPFSFPQCRQAGQNWGTWGSCGCLYWIAFIVQAGLGWGGWLRTNVYAACSGGVVGLSWGDVDSFRDDPQYKVMKYLVFGTISSSLLSEL